MIQNKEKEGLSPSLRRVTLKHNGGFCCWTDFILLE